MASKCGQEASERKPQRCHFPSNLSISRLRAPQAAIAQNPQTAVQAKGLSRCLAVIGDEPTWDKRPGNVDGLLACPSQARRPGNAKPIVQQLRSQSFEKCARVRPSAPVQTRNTYQQHSFRSALSCTAKLPTPRLVIQPRCQAFVEMTSCDGAVKV